MRSQANRIEPIFGKADYASLVPGVIIAAGEQTVNLLDAGHRAGDAIVRSTQLQKKLQDAFKEVLKGKALPLAKVAPTSRVASAGPASPSRRSGPFSRARRGRTSPTSSLRFRSQRCTT
jgi:CRISPR-associated protein Csb1